MFVQQFNNSIWRGEKKNGTKAKTIWQVGEWWHYNIPCICPRHTHHNCTHAIVCECMRACVPGAPSNFIWLFHMLNHQCHCRFSRYLQHQAVPERGVQTHSPSPVLCIRSWTAYCVMCMCGHRMSRGSYLHLVNLLATVHTESSMYRCACERRRKRSPRRDEQTLTNGKHTHTDKSESSSLTGIWMPAASHNCKKEKKIAAHKHIRNGHIFESYTCIKAIAWDAQASQLHSILIACTV